MAKFVVEKNRIFTENANRPHGYGSLNLETFKPFSKNPPISSIFREMGLADELGSGMRNTYKYTGLYSGADPEFVEGDIFQTIIPLSEAATEKVGPDTIHGVQVTGQATGQAAGQAAKTEKLLVFCKEPKTREEMQEYLGISSCEHFTKEFLDPIRNNSIRMTIPDKPTSPNQKYVTS